MRGLDLRAMPPGGVSRIEAQILSLRELIHCWDPGGEPQDVV
jgi:hypothetical protein